MTSSALAHAHDADSGRPGWKLLVLLLASTFAVAGLGSWATIGNVEGWYADADKPWFTPPNYLFGPVWTALYAAMALAAWLAARAGASLRWWWAQLVVNAVWTPIFFALQWLWVGVAVILVLDVLVAVTLVVFWRRSRPAGALMAPYLAWVLFASAPKCGCRSAQLSRTTQDWGQMSPMRQARDVQIDPTLLDDLTWRGLIADSTDREALASALARGSVRFYIGFDPTAPSLHIGNLLQIVTAKRLQQAGHTPYALVGGATGMIGDPKDSGERTLNSLDTVKDWTQRVRRQIEPFLSFEGANAATMVNNYDWTAPMSTIDFLRDVGKHFPVNRMLARDTVRNRLESGISYTEFSYVLLQSFDYLTLHRDFGVSLQFGGSDQWGNITGGVELIRRATGDVVHAFTTPLVTKADGTKYGKSEGGALWLDPEMMSPYAFHQFWLNIEDASVGQMLRLFTFLSPEEIVELDEATAGEPWKRAGQSALADHMTTMVHGAEQTEQAKAAAKALFGGADLAALSDATLTSALAEAGTVVLSRSDDLSVVNLLLATGLVASRGEARRTIAEGGAYVNNVRVESEDDVVQPTQLLHDRMLVLRRGKKRFAGVEVR